MIILVGGPIFFAPLALFAVFGYIAARRTHRLGAAIAEREEKDSRKYDFIIETLQSMQTVKSLAMEPLMMRRFERQQSAASAVVRRLINLTGAAQNYSALYTSMSAATIVCVGALLVLSGQLTIGGLACCMLLSSQLLQPLLRSLAAWNEFHLADHRRERVAAIFDDADLEIDDIRTQEAPRAPGSAPQKALTPKDVSIKGVSIRRGDAEPVFRKVSLTVPAGSFIALSGEDDGGRTSLLRAIIGDVQPDEGEIRIGGKRIEKMDACPLRASIRYVEETPTTFRGTILENLTIFGELPTEAALWASKLIGLDDDVIRMPLGYDTPLRSAAGRDIPAATAQRICIARALATKPSVLILDEANASLDLQGEKRLIEALETLRGSMTIILSTHRPSLIALADDAYAVKNGAVVPMAKEAPRQRSAQQ